VMLALASVVAIPLGLLVGVYLSEFKATATKSIVRFVVDLLTSVPSIVVGLFVYALVVQPMKTYSALAGGIAYAMMMFPVLAKGTEEVLRVFPGILREAGKALGYNSIETLWFFVIKGSRPALVTMILLSFARVAGETAPLLFTAFGNRFWIENLTQPTASLPVQIYSYATSPFPEWHQQAWSAALVLLGFVLFVNIVSRGFQWFTTKRRS
jgi:phosphate transport system permease protein